MPNKKPWEKDEFINFLNDVNKIATEKYGWNVDAHFFETDEILTLTLTPAMGADEKNRKF